MEGSVHTHTHTHTHTQTKAQMSQYTCAWLLNCFSCVQLFTTLWTVAHQSPLQIHQVRILEWVAVPSFMESFNPGIDPVSPTTILIAFEIRSNVFLSKYPVIAVHANYQIFQVTSLVLCENIKRHRGIISSSLDKMIHNLKS